jgi:branched-subunit amino acid transport protein
VTDVWITIAVLAVATAITRGIGPAALGDRALSPAIERVISLLAPALLAALIVTETFGAPGPSITLDARAAGLVAAGGVLAAGRSMVAAVLAAAFATGLLRLIT